MPKSVVKSWGSGDLRTRKKEDDEFRHKYPYLGEKPVCMGPDIAKFFLDRIESVAETGNEEGWPIPIEEIEDKFCRRCKFGLLRYFSSDCRGCSFQEITFTPKEK